MIEELTHLKEDSKNIGGGQSIVTVVENTKKKNKFYIKKYSELIKMKENPDGLRELKVLLEAKAKNSPGRDVIVKLCFFCVEIVKNEKGTLLEIKLILFLERLQPLKTLKFEEYSLYEQS